MFFIVSVSIEQVREVVTEIVKPLKRRVKRMRVDQKSALSSKRSTSERGWVRDNGTCRISIVMLTIKSVPY